MKKYAIILLCVFFGGVVQAQLEPPATVSESELSSLRKEFQKLLHGKEYKEAMVKAVEISEALLQQQRYKEAASLYYQMDQLVADCDKSTGKKNFDLHFMAANQRLRLYTREGKPESSKSQLNTLRYCMNHLKDETLRDQMLLTEAEYYSEFGMTTRSMERYREILQRCVARSAEDERENCYKSMLGYAERKKMPQLTKTVQGQYTAWQDSIKMVKAARELSTLKQEHQALQEDLKEKEETISNNSIVTIGLWTLIVILAAVVLILFILLLKNIYQTRKYKNSLKIANESNAQKSHFISNINTQITPSLDSMDAAMAEPSSGAVLEESIYQLRERIEHMQTYITLEESREESYKASTVDIKLLCENIMFKVKDNFRSGIEAVVSVPKVSIKTNAEALETILTYLLDRAAIYTDEGKISLEFKKRNARTGQFIITDTGTSIEPEKLDGLFKPFTEIDPKVPKYDWILPICQLMSYKLNGTLKVDTDYKKGTRFILDLCS